MLIKFKNCPNIENNKNKAGLKSTSPASFAHRVSSSHANKYEERPLKSNPKDLSFKGLKVSDAVESFRKEIGNGAAEHLEEVIERLTSKEDPIVKSIFELNSDGELDFKKDTFGRKLYRAVVDPVIYFPVDLANSTLNLLKKIPGLKNAKFIDDRLGKGILHRRSTDLEKLSNAMALRHYSEMLDDIKKAKVENKDNDKVKEKILNEALKRCNNRISPYTVKGERSLTRLVSGIIPAFFLANDAYNLSMYVNNNKDLAEKEKKRRFYQELSRVIVTAGATFGTLGFFAKEVSSNPQTTIGVIAALTFCSELIGRMLVGTPVYPLDKEGAKKYAKLQHKDSLNQHKDKNIDSSKAINKKNKSGSDYALKLLGGLVIAGFLIDCRNNIKPVRKLVNNLTSRYKEFFAKDYNVKKSDFKNIVKKLRDNGFNGIADSYEEKVKEIIDEGNLTTKELIKVKREIDNRAERSMPGIIFNEKELKEQQEIEKKKVKREDVIKDLFSNKQNGAELKDDEFIHIGGDLKDVDKVKDTIINGVLALPIKFAWEILNMPYQYVVKPLIELPLKRGDLLKGKDKGSSWDETFRTSVEYLQKNLHATDFKEKVNKNIIDALDNVNKSNLSSAELAGSAKTAVSTATSAFLILDNYNMVMIDSEGKDKKLAEQKAKERTIQRIVRIAYGAVLIKLFNGLFRTHYNASLLGAEAVTTGSTLITETLERTSVGMPLHEATREEIIQKDNETLNATGLKGSYFRFMSKLTGKKPFSSQKADK